MQMNVQQMNLGLFPARVEVEEVETEVMRELKARRAEHYLRGPIRWADIQAAAKLGGSCLALLIAIHHRATVTGYDVVTLPSGYLSDLGIDRMAKWRALKMLEAEKFIIVMRSPGNSARIKLNKRWLKRKRKA
jgi:hypothetical protein